MDVIVEQIFTWAQKNFKNPRLYAVLAVLIIIIALVFPYIDANILFYGRIEQRVNILQELSEIDLEKISQSEVLQEEYNAILSEIANQRQWSFTGLDQSTQDTDSKSIALAKFLTGGILAWILTICVPFMNTFEDRKSKIAAFILVAFVGFLLGLIGYIIPTIVNPLINCIGFPVLQIIFVASLSIKQKTQ